MNKRLSIILKDPHFLKIQEPGMNKIGSLIVVRDLYVFESLSMSKYSLKNLYFHI